MDAGQGEDPDGGEDIFIFVSVSVFLIVSKSLCSEL